MCFIGCLDVLRKLFGIIAVIKGLQTTVSTVGKEILMDADEYSIKIYSDAS